MVLQNKKKIYLKYYATLNYWEDQKNISSAETRNLQKKIPALHASPIFSKQSIITHIFGFFLQFFDVLNIILVGNKYLLLCHPLLPLTLITISA